MPSSAIDQFCHYPLYLQWNLLLLVGACMLCVLACGGGALLQWLRRDSALPPIELRPGSSFPNAADTIITLLFIVFFTCATAQKYLISELDTPVLQEGGPGKMAGLVLTLVVYQLMLYSPFLLRYSWLPGLPEEDRTTLLRQCMYAIGGVLFMFTFSLICEACHYYDWVAEVSDSPMLQTVVTSLIQGDTATRAIIIIAAVIIAPVCEECCYRGILYNVLKRRAGAVVAALCSSLLFAAMHTSLVQTLPLMVLALMQCFLYEKTRSLRTCIIVHMLFNALATLGAIFQASA